MPLVLSFNFRFPVPVASAEAPIALTISNHSKLAPVSTN